MEKINLVVKGMTCMGCVRSVRNVLEPIPGMSSVDINLESGQVNIDYDATQSSPEKFRNAISDAGYEVVS